MSPLPPWLEINSQLLGLRGWIPLSSFSNQRGFVCSSGLSHTWVTPLILKLHDSVLAIIEETFRKEKCLRPMSDFLVLLRNCGNGIAFRQNIIQRSIVGFWIIENGTLGCVKPEPQFKPTPHEKGHPTLHGKRDVKKILRPCCRECAVLSLQFDLQKK